ncbi:hypothetical protein [Silvanigrella sp.]|jgi:hypothetical protein|uniref:hypothetical protein n=1 Tax=Silvanigrella sp. TaxID=2024976 RepID=UPI0037C678EF
MKKTKSKKLTNFILFLFVLAILIFSFKNQIYGFLINFKSLSEIINKAHLDEYIDLETSNYVNINYLKYTNMISDKNLFEYFHYPKKNKVKKINLNDLILKDNNILNIEKTKSIDDVISYKYMNDKNSVLKMKSIILLPGESITCDCLELIADQTLIFENKGVAANKFETPSTLNITYDNNETNSFEIKNNKITKIQIPSGLNSKGITLSWNKNPSGILIFHGIEKPQNKNKSIFINLKSKNISNNFYKDISSFYSKEKLFINRNSFPLAAKYEENIITLESFNNYLNNGFTYKSHDIFIENEKNLLKQVNLNSKYLLRINVSFKDSKEQAIEHANTLIKINREKSILNIDKLISESINISSSDIVRIDISPKEDDTENTVLSILKQIDKNNNIFILIGNDFDMNKHNNLSDQSIIMFLPQNESTSFKSISQLNEYTPIQQNLLLDIFLLNIKNQKIPEQIIKKEKVISTLSEQDEYYIFNENDFYSNNKFHIPYNKMHDYNDIIRQSRNRYQIRDILITFFKFRNIKFKLTSKDKIARCFSNQNIKLGQIYFDSKFETYIADLKIQGDDVIEELQVSCLIHSENFLNDYKIEASKDSKQLNQLQIGMGQYLLQPNTNIIKDNSLYFNNISDFNLLYSFKNPANFFPNESKDIIIWSQNYPSLSNNLNYAISCKEKK